MKKLYLDSPDMFFNFAGGEAWYFSVEEKEILSESEIRSKYNDEDLDMKTLSDRYVELPYREEFEDEALVIFWKSLNEEQYAVTNSLRGRGFYSKLRDCGLHDILDEILDMLFREEIAAWETHYGFQVAYPG